MLTDHYNTLSKPISPNSVVASSRLAYRYTAQLGRDRISESSGGSHQAKLPPTHLLQRYDYFVNRQQTSIRNSPVEDEYPDHELLVCFDYSEAFRQPSDSSGANQKISTEEIENTHRGKRKFFGRIK